MSFAQQRFSSRLATLVTMAGLAIGLGNVWRFPYMMGQHGGSAFLLVYTIFMLALAAPALAAELSLGRATRSGPVAAFQAAFGRTAGLIAGLLALFAAFMATCYYSLVIGNVFYSAGFAAAYGFSDTTLAGYNEGLAQHGLQLAIGLVVLLVCAGVVQRGLRKGIEAANKVLMPLFGVATLYLVYVALRQDGAVEQLTNFLSPDFSRTGPDIWFAAMGQACFSVGLSGTLGVMYGSYLRREAAIMPTALGTCLIDLGAAFMAALFVVPTVLVFGLDLGAGPGLLFNTLPHLFAAMPGGRTLAPLFLAAWAGVAMLTLIAALDTVSGALAQLASNRADATGTLTERATGNHRRRWLWGVSGAGCLVMTPIGFNPHWIGVLDLVFGSGMFMLGALLAVLAIGWGLGARTTLEQLTVGLPGWAARLATIWVRFIVPLSLGAILAGFLYNNLMS